MVQYQPEHLDTQQDRQGIDGNTVDKVHTVFQYDTGACPGVKPERNAWHDPLIAHYIERRQ